MDEDGRDVAIREPEMDDRAATDARAELERISLAHALRDFEVANARAVDLAGRLTSLSSELTEARRELDELRSQHEALLSAHEAMRRSAAYRLASRIWAVRNAIGL
jgi:predicted  nucleic acid-binding Zn-ribbon protein